VLASLPLRFSPGTRWEYSNEGYELLGTIVELASRSSYQTFVEDAVFRPLGMTQSFLLPSDRQSRPNVAASYVASNGIDQRELKRVDREGVLELRYLDGLPGAGTAYVTPIDMVKYDAAWRAGFPGLQSGLVTQMLQPTGPAQEFAYGLGVFVGFPEITEPALQQQLARLGPKVMTHSGGWPAFYTQFAFTFNRDYLRDDAGAILNLTPDEQRQLSDEMLGTSFTKMLADVAETALVGKSVFACGRF
jgi:CubicO group peptidase (beta-lactamase class C family)